MKKSTIHTISIVTIPIFFIVFMFIDQAISRPIHTTNDISLKDTMSFNFSYRNNQNKLSIREHINIDDDNSLYKYVNTNTPLDDKTYVPAMLVPISSQYVIQRSK